MPFLNTFGAGSNKSFGLTRRRIFGYVGQNVYTGLGCYSITVPVGATRMSVVAIGSGQSGGGGGYYGRGYCVSCCCGIPFTYRYSYTFGGGGGQGGNLGYKNCIAVTPGQTIGISIYSSVTIPAVSVAGTNITWSPTQYSGGAGGAGNYRCIGGYCQNPGNSLGGSGGNAAGYTGNGAKGADAGGNMGASTTYYGAGSGSAGGGGAGGTGYYPAASTSGSAGIGGAVRIMWSYTDGPVRKFPCSAGDL